MTSGEFLCALVCRAGGTVALLPLPEGALSIPARVAAVMVLALFAWTGTFPDASTPFSADCLAIEILTGAVVSLPLALMIQAASAWGALFDGARGQSIGNVYDPLSAVQQGISSTLAANYLWYAALINAALPRLVTAFMQSLHDTPVGARGVEIIARHSETMILMSAHALGEAFVFMLPFALLFLCVDLGIGFIGKIAPAFSLQSEAFLLKSIIGSLFIFAAIEAGLGTELLSLLR